MRRWLALAAALLAMTACTRPPPARTTVQQYMENEVNPAAEFLFRSVRDVSDAGGARLEAPKSEAGWKEVREQLAVLQAAPEVLGAKGLKAAPAGFKSEHPGIESEPAWIQTAIDSNRADFDRRAQRLRQAADRAAQAAEAHDPRALQRALDGVDKACESCHLHYFYPNDKRAWQAAKDDGVGD